eukprot:gb/GECH01006781.1/.p1 GENE.gb/GECH01006781.1/~~gb/GECH01006781.1/.p1  ORF type:complete len:110 (+),score=32.01 gb/GECH01006781.1/:1-330(+)
MMASGNGNGGDGDGGPTPRVDLHLDYGIDVGGNHDGVALPAEIENDDNDGIDDRDFHVHDDDNDDDLDRDGAYDDTDPQNAVGDDHQMILFLILILEKMIDSRLMNHTR